jgi:hypothetical protein
VLGDEDVLHQGGDAAVMRELLPAIIPFCGVGQDLDEQLGVDGGVYIL